MFNKTFLKLYLLYYNVDCPGVCYQVKKIVLKLMNAKAYFSGQNCTKSHCREKKCSKASRQTEVIQKESFSKVKGEENINQKTKTF